MRMRAVGACSAGEPGVPGVAGRAFNPPYNGEAFPLLKQGAYDGDASETQDKDAFSPRG